MDYLQGVVGLNQKADTMMKSQAANLEAARIELGSRLNQPPTTAVNPMAAIINSFANTVERLEANAEKLTKRLDPLLMPQPGLDQSSAQRPPSASLIMALDQLEQRIERTNIQLADLIERLCL